MTWEKTIETLRADSNTWDYVVTLKWMSSFYYLEVDDIITHICWSSTV